MCCLVETHAYVNVNLSLSHIAPYHPYLKPRQSYAIIAAGKEDPDDESGKALSSVEAYDTHRGGQWREVPEMLLARKQHGCAVFTGRDRSTVRGG